MIKRRKMSEKGVKGVHGMGCGFKQGGYDRPNFQK